MPVLLTIHSSDVSTIRSRSALAQHAGRRVSPPTGDVGADRLRPVGHSGSTSMSGCFALTSVPLSGDHADHPPGEIRLDLVETASSPR
jgi:hypothetical protein